MFFRLTFFGRLRYSMRARFSVILRDLKPHSVAAQPIRRVPVVAILA